MESFIAVDNPRALVAIGELPQFKEVPKFNGAIYESAFVAEGEEVLTRRPEEQGSQKLFEGYVKDPEGKMGTSFDGGGLGGAVVNQIGRVERNARKGRRSR